MIDRGSLNNIILYIISLPHLHIMQMSSCIIHKVTEHSVLMH